ncbi:MAG: carbohydrate kinase family protein [Candidatus Peribacteraceae bacterium]|nr:carbohydrate kinase family protein [Candidatus Peribacteraceae bacterium]MDD5739279.1 carbohydrate kinase family protein [Candidatus Peribacteraceae bacterium]
MPKSSLRETVGPSVPFFDERQLLSWGFTPEEVLTALQRLRDPDRPRNLVLDYGTTALDVKHKGNYANDRYMGGLALVGPDGRVIGTGEAFTEPEEALQVDGHTGGIANAAFAVARVLEAEARERGAVDAGVANTRNKIWALMACLGDDRAGEIYKCKIPRSVIDVDLLRVQEDTTSGLADIRIQQQRSGRVKKGDRAIYFNAGASGRTRLTKEDMLEIARRGPFNFNISYPGLFPEGMDGDDGASLDQLVTQAQEFCPMVSMDIHGFTKMEHIRPALSHVDLFNANLVEAARVFCGETIDAAEELTDGKKHALHRRLFAAMQPFLVSPTGRTRMFTITDAKGCFIIFQTPKGDVQTKYVASSCSDIPAKDKTGAGDVRFGMQRLWMAREKAKAWQSGTFNLKDAKQAVQIGQIATTLHIQGRQANALEGVTLARLARVAQSGEQFKTLRRLRGVLMNAA